MSCAAHCRSLKRCNVLRPLASVSFFVETAECVRARGWPALACTGSRSESCARNLPIRESRKYSPGRNTICWLGHHAYLPQLAFSTPPLTPCYGPTVLTVNCNPTQTPPLYCSVDELAGRFTKEPFIQVGEGPNGFPFVLLRHDSGCEAMVHLHGGHVTSWTDRDNLEMLFVHPDNDWDPTEPIRCALAG